MPPISSFVRGFDLSVVEICAHYSDDGCHYDGNDELFKINKEIFKIDFFHIIRFVLFSLAYKKAVKFMQILYRKMSKIAIACGLL